MEVAGWMEGRGNVGKLLEWQGVGRTVELFSKLVIARREVREGVCSVGTLVVSASPLPTSVELLIVV